MERWMLVGLCIWVSGFGFGLFVGIKLMRRQFDEYIRLTAANR